MAKRKYTRRKIKKKKEVVELVATCDYCGKSLGRTCARTDQSGICAGGCGISVVDPGMMSNRRKVDKWMFFCNPLCLGKFNEGLNTI